MLGSREENERKPRRKKKKNTISATSGKPEASAFPPGPVLPVPLFPGAVLAVAQGLRAGYGVI